MECEASTFSFKYLRMPFLDKKLTKDHYMALIEAIQNELLCWKTSMLSVDGRLTLLNAPSTQWVIKDIDKIIRTFL
jgi:hypothetical protein